MNLFNLIFFFNISFIFCGEIKNQIYYEFPQHSVSHCVRRLNRTSAIGCSSKSEGNIGILNVAFNQSDLSKKISQLNSDTIFVLSSSLFVQQNVTDILLLNKFIQGLIVIESKFCDENICFANTHDKFSEDYRLPNPNYSFSNNHIFNPAGSELGFKNWPFPIAYLNERYRSEHVKIVSCYKKYNIKPNSKSRCAFEMRNFMAAVKSAETCLKYQAIQDRFGGLFSQFQYCTDFTGMNYVVSGKEKVKSRGLDSVIVLMSRLDSLSMFERSAVSANGAITSTALLLSVMKLLMSQPQFKSGQNLTKDVLFVFLDNESYDYLGSNRFFYDLYKNQISKSSSVPIKSEHLGLLLEFGELAFTKYSQLSLFHQRSNMTEKQVNLTNSYLSALHRQFSQFGFGNISDIGHFDLPPSSSRFFVSKRMIPSIVMADHRETFLNPFYNSFLDNNRKENNSDILLGIANAVASFIFKETTGHNLTNHISPSDEYTPDKIIECFTNNLLCELLQKVLPMTTLQKLNDLGTPIPTQAHSSTKGIPMDYRFSYLLQNLIVYLSGQKMNNSECKCSNCSNLEWIEPSNGTKQCYKTRLTSYDEFSFTSVSEPMWLTSAIVDGQSSRMFISRPNRSLLTTGTIITLVTLTLSLFITPNVAVIFTKSPLNNVIC